MEWPAGRPVRALPGAGSTGRGRRGPGRATRALPRALRRRSRRRRLPCHGRHRGPPRAQPATAGWRSSPQAPPGTGSPEPADTPVTPL